MLGKRTKKVLALVMSVFMLAGLCHPATKAAAAEADSTSPSFIWEEVEDFQLPGEEVAPVEEVEEESYDADETVRVVIVFDKCSTADAGYDITEISEDSSAQAYSEKLVEGQNEVIEQIEAEVMEGEKLDTRYSFTLLANAVSANVKFGDIDAIESVDGVSAVYVAPVYYLTAEDEPNTVTSGEMVGSYKTWNFGYTGAGMKIAIIDTGLDIDHPSFDEKAYLYSLQEQADKKGVSIKSYDTLDEADLVQLVDSLNAKSFYESKGELTAADLYRNAKVPYAFNYVDKSLVITHDNDSQGDHGTHVAGIAAANKYVPAADGTFERQAAGVTGIAPDAQLLIMKVFGAAGGAYSDDYMAAIEDALVLGADTVNLSLGSGNAGESKCDSEYFQSIFDSLEKYNTIVSISAGNAGAWADNSKSGRTLASDVNQATNGSPGSYTNAFTVASAINSGYTAPGFVAQGEATTLYLENTSYGNKALATLAEGEVSKEYEYVFLDAKGLEADYANVDVTGKIVFVSRGSSSFYEKHILAATNGAIACVIYNNQAGKNGLNLTGTTVTIPCVSIEQADGMTIKELSAYDASTGAYTGKVAIFRDVLTDHNAAGGYLMSDFSSWGVPGDLALKPEITAPGQYIYSTLDGGTYGLMSGTSMAAPCVAGLSALVLQHVKENNLAEGTGLTQRALAQSLLMSTASQLTDKDGKVYSPRKQGAGLANAEAATSSQAYILVGDTTANDGKVKAELGDDPTRSGEYAFDFTVYNLGTSTLYYDLGSILMTDTNVDGYIAQQASYLASKATFTADNEQLVYDINNDGRINAEDVKTFLKVINQSKESDIIATYADFYDLDGNGVVDTNDVKTLYTAVLGRGAETVDLSKKVVAVDSETHISVSIKLTDADKKFIDDNFVNGMFVEGYVTLDGKTDLSIPVLAFYGNWTDSSMFEPFDMMEYVWEGKSFSYSGVSPTNYITYKMANSTKTSYFISNMYAKELDDEYIADRNSMSSLSGDVIPSITYTTIRNAKTHAFVKNAETGEIYYSSPVTSRIGEYYRESSSAWMNTSASQSINWAGTDAEGKPLADGTKVLIGVQALPAYYDDETKVPGAGSELTFPMVIDNTKPTASFDAFTRVNNKGILTVHDNRYVAAVYVFDGYQEKILASYNVNQTEADTDVKLEVISPDDVYFVAIIDYAGNLTAYRANYSGEKDTEIAGSIEISQTEAELVLGSGVQLSAKVGPVTLMDHSVTWTTTDEEIATVSANGYVTAVKPGTATISAVSVSLGEDGEPLTAECSVTCKAVEIDLNAIVWDEEGKVFFSEFNTATLPEYNKISEAQDRDYWSVVVNGNGMFADARGEEDPYSVLVKIDPATFEETVIDEKAFWMTDLASTYWTDMLIGTVLNYITVYDGDESLGVLDLSKYMEGEYLVGATYYDYGLSFSGGILLYDYMILVDNAGAVILMRVSTNYSTGAISFAFGSLGNCGITTNGLAYYQSLYYDQESDYLLYSNYNDDDEVELYALLLDEEKDYTIAASLGTFPEKVWPVSGLFHMPEVKEEKVDPETSGEILSAFASVEVQEADVQFISKEEVTFDLTNANLVKKYNSANAEDTAAPAPAEEETPAPAEEEAPAPSEEEAPAPADEETPAPSEEEAPAPETPATEESGEEITEPVEETPVVEPQPTEPEQPEEPAPAPEPEEEEEKEEGGIIGFFKRIGKWFKRRNN